VIAADSPRAAETYTRLYRTRPTSLGLPMLLVTLALLPVLLVLACIRLLTFLLINGAYLVLPRNRWRRFLKLEWLNRLILFLCTGIIFRAPGFDGASGSCRRLVVMNHHGVQDVFLFHFLGRLGVTRLVVSYGPQFYARMRRWVFFFDHEFDLVPVSQGRKTISAGADGVTMVFPEGAGKKGPFVLNFQPSIFWLHEEVEPFAVSFKWAIPLVDAYGVDLPWHRSVCFLLLILTPWTVVTVRQLPPFRFDRSQPFKASEQCRDLIAKAAGYQAIDFLFDQRGFDACMGASLPRGTVFFSRSLPGPCNEPKES
jgi:hypothetical protein